VKGGQLETLPVHLFRDSFGPFITLLNEHEVRYSMLRLDRVFPWHLLG